MKQHLILIIVLSFTTYPLNALKHCVCLGSKWDAEIERQKKEEELQKKLAQEKLEQSSDPAVVTAAKEAEKKITEAPAAPPTEEKKSTAAQPQLTTNPGRSELKEAEQKAQTQQSGLTQLFEKVPPMLAVVSAHQQIQEKKSEQKGSAVQPVQQQQPAEKNPASALPASELPAEESCPLNAEEEQFLETGEQDSSDEPDQPFIKKAFKKIKRSVQAPVDYVTGHKKMATAVSAVSATAFLVTWQIARWLNAAKTMMGGGSLVPDASSVASSIEAVTQNPPAEQQLVPQPTPTPLTDSPVSEISPVNPADPLPEESGQNWDEMLDILNANSDAQSGADPADSTKPNKWGALKTQELEAENAALKKKLEQALDNLHTAEQVAVQEMEEKKGLETTLKRTLVRLDSVQNLTAEQQKEKNEALEALADVQKKLSQTAKELEEKRLEAEGAEEVIRDLTKKPENQTAHNRGTEIKTVNNEAETKALQKELERVQGELNKTQGKLKLTEEERNQRQRSSRWKDEELREMLEKVKRVNDEKMRLQQEAASSGPTNFEGDSSVDDLRKKVEELTAELNAKKELARRGEL